MKIIREPLPGLFVIKPNVHKDERGFFLETWQHERFKEIGINKEFVQDNWSRSSKDVLRGLHFQLKHPQGKLVSVRRGAIYDVAVDIRENSETFGQWHGEVLSDENHLQIYIPPGFAHGFSVLSKIVDFNYKCTEYYHPDDEGGILWNDSDLKIHWKIDHPVVSEKDQKLLPFSELKLSDNLQPILQCSGLEK